MKGAYLDFKRALIRVLKGAYCKSIRRLLEAKRAHISIEPCENILQKCVYFNAGDAEQVEDGR